MLAGRKALGEFSGRIGLAGTRAPASITHTDNTSALATPEQTPRPESWSQGLGDATLEADRAPEGVGVNTGSGSGEGGSSADCSPTAPIGTDTPTIEESSVDSRWLVWRGVKQHGKAAGNMCAFVPQVGSIHTNIRTHATHTAEQRTPDLYVRVNTSVCACVSVCVGVCVPCQSYSIRGAVNVCVFGGLAQH